MLDKGVGELITFSLFSYQPEKISGIDAILQKVAGKPERFESLLSKLVEKYGEEPENGDEDAGGDESDEGESQDAETSIELNEALENRIRTFYLHYNDSKLDNVRDLVLRTKNKPKYEERLMRMLVKKYGPEPEAELTEEQAFRARLERFYRKYQPNKLSSVDALVAKADGKDSQEQLFRMLVSKYGPEPAEQALRKEAKAEQSKATSAASGALFREVEYCPVDGMPPEYCEFLPTFEQCLPWLLEHCADLKLTTKEDKTVAEYMQALETDGDPEEKKKKDTRGGKGRPNKNMSKKGKKGKKEPKITIERTSRSKRKFITVVAGLDTFDLKLKEVAKKLGKRFACSASVSKLATGGQSVDIQGDVCYELPDLLLQYFPVIDKDKIFLIEDGKESKVY